MLFVSPATDYDNTLATDWAAEAETLEALKAVKQSRGNVLSLVAGRELSDLMAVFADAGLVDLPSPRTPPYSTIPPPDDETWPHHLRGGRLHVLARISAPYTAGAKSSGSTTPTSPDL